VNAVSNTADEQETCDRANPLPTSPQLKRSERRIPSNTSTCPTEKPALEETTRNGE